MKLGGVGSNESLVLEEFCLREDLTLESEEMGVGPDWDAELLRRSEEAIGTYALGVGVCSWIVDYCVERSCFVIDESRE